MKDHIQNPEFKVPGDYFEKSKSNTIANITSMAQDDSASMIPIHQQPPRKLIPLMMKYASVAACLAIGIYFITQEKDHPILSEPDLSLEYVDYLIDNTDALTLDDLDAFGGLMSDDFIEDDELIDYLEEVDLEDILDLI